MPDKTLPDKPPPKKSSKFQESSTNSSSSSPCSLPESDPVYAGYMSHAEIVDFLNELLEGERAGAKVALHMAKEAGDEQTESALTHIRFDEAQFCGMLAKHLKRYGAEPSVATGAFRDRVLSEPDLSSQVKLLLRGQAWVIRKINEALPRIDDDVLYNDLRQMADVHVADIASCERLI